MADKKSPSPEKVESYTISITGGDKQRTIKLSSGLFRFGVASVIIGGVLLIGTAAFSFYSAMRMQRDASTIQEIDQAAQLRQEQLLTLSKKAATLNETIQNLAQQEKELRIQAGLNPPKEDTPPETPAPADVQPAAENSDAPADAAQPADAQPADAQPAETQPAETQPNGQGGPIAELDIADVSESLDMLEVKVSTRKESLDDFQIGRAHV